MNEEEIVLTPMMKQFLDLKAKHPDAVMLFRCGDFYETYSTDAIVASEILGITLTKRANGKGKTIEMAGFPHHALDTYLPKLIRAGKRRGAARAVVGGILHHFSHAGLTVQLDQVHDVFRGLAEKVAAHAGSLVKVGLRDGVVKPVVQHGGGFFRRAEAHLIGLATAAHAGVGTLEA